MKLNKLTDYAIIILTEFAENSYHSMSAHTLAEKTKLPQPTIAKILKLLRKADLLESVQGIHGGYILKQPIRKITLLHVVNALDGENVIECLDNNGACKYLTKCTNVHVWKSVNQRLQNVLEEFTLEEILNLKSFH